MKCGYLCNYVHVMNVELKCVCEERWAEERLAQAGAGVHAVPLHHVHRRHPPLQDQQVTLHRYPGSRLLSINLS